MVEDKESPFQPFKEEEEQGETCSVKNNIFVPANYSPKILLFFFEFVRDQPDLFVGFFIQHGEEDDLAGFSFDGDGGVLCLTLGVGEGDLHAGAAHLIGGRPIAGDGVYLAGHGAFVARTDADGRFVEFNHRGLIVTALDAAVGVEMFGLRGGKADFFFRIGHS